MIKTRELYRPSLGRWHRNGEQCRAVCETIAQAGAISNPSIILCSSQEMSPLLFSSSNSFNFPVSPDPRVLSFTHLVCSHLALGALAGLQPLVEGPLDGLHLRGDGLEGLLIVLLPLQSLVQTLLLLADLWQEREEGQRDTQRDKNDGFWYNPQ